VARTFSKAYGLAGLALGGFGAAEEQMRWIRRAASPYSVNSVALVCLARRARRRRNICAGTRTRSWRPGLSSKPSCSALASPTGRRARISCSSTIGPKHRAFVEAMRSRGVLVRDRSADPGCDGCVRITSAHASKQSRASPRSKSRSPRSDGPGRTHEEEAHGDNRPQNRGNRDFT